MKPLQDYLRKGMKLVIVGCNPTESSVRAGHYYAGRGNPFWPLLYDSGVVPEPFDYPDDRRIIEFGIGLTYLVKGFSSSMVFVGRFTRSGRPMPNSMMRRRPGGLKASGTTPLSERSGPTRVCPPG